MSGYRSAVIAGGMESMYSRITLSHQTLLLITCLFSGRTFHFICREHELAIDQVIKASWMASLRTDYGTSITISTWVRRIKYHVYIVCNCSLFLMFMSLFHRLKKVIVVNHAPRHITYRAVNKTISQFRVMCERRQLRALIYSTSRLLQSPYPL